MKWTHKITYTPRDYWWYACVKDGLLTLSQPGTSVVGNRYPGIWLSVEDTYHSNEYLVEKMSTFKGNL